MHLNSLKNLKRDIYIKDLWRVGFRVVPFYGSHWMVKVAGNHRIFCLREKKPGYEGKPVYVNHSDRKGFKSLSLQSLVASFSIQDKFAKCSLCLWFYICNYFIKGPQNCADSCPSNLHNFQCWAQWSTKVSVKLLEKSFQTLKQGWYSSVTNSRVWPC